MSRFERDTNVTPTGAGSYRAEMDRGWWITQGPNGGYLAAVLLRAMQASIEDPDRTPRSLTVHYLRPPQEGPVEVEVALERAGRTFTSLSARLVQTGKLQLLATGAFSTRRGGLEFQDLAMPDVPPPEEVPPTAAAVIGMHERYERRWLWGTREGARAPVAHCGGWIRLADPGPYDPPLIAALADSWPPPIFQRELDRPSGGAPTIDLTIHFRAPARVERLAPEEWVLAQFRSRVARDGFIEEDGELWSRDGMLLAQSRQLAVLRTD